MGTCSLVRKCTSKISITGDDTIHYHLLINENAVVAFKDEIAANQENAFKYELATNVKLLAGDRVIKASK